METERDAEQWSERYSIKIILLHSYDKFIDILAICECYLLVY